MKIEARKQVVEEEERRKADIASMKKSPHVPLRQITEEKRRGKEIGVV
jgi:hypothetical protein